jgi:hypothetical protein
MPTELITTQKQDQVSAKLATSPNARLPLPKSFVAGDIVGSYLDHPIFSDLTDDHGVVRTFSGIAISASCKPGAIIIAPGLLYEIVKTK